MNSSDTDEIEILQGILEEVRELNQQLARTDERSRMNKNRVESLREDRIGPVEKQADLNENRSRRNTIIISAFLTIMTLAVGAGLTQLIPNML